MEEVSAHVHLEPIVPDVLSRQHEHRSGVLGRTYSSATVRLPVGCLHGLRWFQMNMILEVDDMASVAIQQPPANPSQMAVFAKKVQTIMWRCMVSIGSTLGCTPSQHDIQQTFSVQLSLRRPREHVLDRGARGVKRVARRQPDCGVGGGRPPVPPIPHSLGLTQASQSLPSGFGTSQTPPPPGLGFDSFQAPHFTSFEFLGFRAPPLPGTAGSSTPHQPVSQASSSDEEERADDMDVVQHYGFGHRVGKKTTRFMPSDWP
ncbi:hypothetical protein M9H77_17422 [Catharanthus roseus]|uniref:Uncharacterized protein n=1 Tax=Catharanthus roseus TaxID=4058 RepID=A0ACC0B4L2_CATRO|nr:hypothetical protein M9H77_17422 [Catharanthus roseus]